MAPDPEESPTTLPDEADTEVGLEFEEESGAGYGNHAPDPEAAPIEED